MKKIINLFSIFILLLIFSCIKKLPYNTSEENAMHNNIYESFEGQEVIFIISTKTVKIKDKELPEEFYITGKIDNGLFIPTNKSVLGKGELAKNGRKGWIELNNQEFYAEESAKSAQSPFISVFLNDKGYYIPSRREIGIIPN